MGKFERYYEGMSAKMTADLATISRAFDHPGASGRNNEKILQKFLELHLPSEYGVTNGKVVAADGQESRETDLILYNKNECPLLMTGADFQLVPIESCICVISIKTRLTKPELSDALNQIASVRNLPRLAATVLVDAANSGTPFRQAFHVAPEKVLRPRAMVFAFESGWSSADMAEEAFRELLNEKHDDLRPNGLCLLDQTHMARKPYSLRLGRYDDYPLLYLFIHLLNIMGSFPRQRPDISMYVGNVSGA